MNRNDAHTVFTTQCYSGWKYILPWVLTTDTTNSNQRVMIHSTTFPHGSQVNTLFTNYGIKSIDFIGWEVVQIKNQTALDYLVDYANTIGYVLDANTRLNVSSTIFV